VRVQVRFQHINAFVPTSSGGVRVTTFFFFSPLEKKKMTEFFPK
jgi:hypothetical protein